MTDWDGSYVQTEVRFENSVTHWWNHGLGQIVTALLEAGMTLTGLAEHDSAPWRPFSRTPMTNAGHGEWRLTEMPERLAATFTIQAVKRA